MQTYLWEKSVAILRKGKKKGEGTSEREFHHKELHFKLKSEGGNWSITLIRLKEQSQGIQVPKQARE